MANKKQENLVDLANKAAENSDWEAAINYLLQAKEKSPKDTGILSGLGACYLQMGKPEESVIYFGEVIKIDDQLPDSYCNLGMAYMATNQFDEAEKAYLKALSIDPKHILTRKNLAVLYVKQNNRLGEGLQLLIDILKENPKDLEILLMLASFYMMGGMYDSVERFCLYALSIDPQNQVAKDMLERIKKENDQNIPTEAEKEANPETPVVSDISRIARPEHAKKLAGLKNLIKNENQNSSPLGSGPVNQIAPPKPGKGKLQGAASAAPSTKTLPLSPTSNLTSEQIQHIQDGKATTYNPLASNNPIAVPVENTITTSVTRNPGLTGSVCMYGGNEFSVGLRLFTMKRALQNMGVNVKIISQFDPADIQNYDTFVFERPQLEQSWLDAFTAAKRAGKKVIVDIEEDFHNLPPEHLGFSIVGQGDPNRLNIFEQVLKSADMVTASSKILTERYRSFAHQIMYLPTYWDKTWEWWSNPAPSHKFFNVGWFDYGSEIPNLSIVKDEVVRFLNDSRNSSLVIAGDINAYHFFEGSLPDEKILFLPFINFEDYPFLLAHFDVEISPLRKSAYNLSKSDFRLVEAGARRIPWIGSKIPAYEDWGAGGLYAEKTGDWYKALKMMYQDSSLRNRLAEEGWTKAREREANSAEARTLLSIVFAQSTTRPVQQISFSTKPDPKDYSTTDNIMVVPCQLEAYHIALNYIEGDDRVLDVGFGIGYGMNNLSTKAKEVYGVDVDKKAFEYCSREVIGKNPKIKEIKIYDGYHLDYPDGFFDVVTCVDVLEHVDKYEEFLSELLRVAKKGVLISTPNRRPEYTNPDGTPMNYWHLREWNYDELNSIMKKHARLDWNFINGPFDGPFTRTKEVINNTLTLTPFMHKLSKAEVGGEIVPPVVMFVFNRADTTQKVLEAIKNQTQKPQELIIFADGPRNTQEEPKVNEVIELVKSIDWIKTHIVQRPHNFGCANNVIYSLNEVFQNFDEAVVIEDDVLVAPSFYQSMCVLLKQYRFNTKVFSVGGYPHLLPGSLANYPFDVIMAPRFSAWGWGTWAERWKRKDLINWHMPRFNQPTIPIIAGQDVPQMAELVRQKPDSFWDLKILIDCLSRGDFHALTRNYLVNNIGMDSGDHGQNGINMDSYSAKFNPIEDKVPENFPEPVLNDEIVSEIQRYLSTVKK